MVEGPPAVQERQKTQGSIPGSGISPGEGNSNPLQYACLGNPTGREAWWATVHGVVRRVRYAWVCTWTHTHTHTHTHTAYWNTDPLTPGWSAAHATKLSPLVQPEGSSSLESSPAFTQTSTWCWHLPVATILVNRLPHMLDDNHPKSRVTRICFYSSTWILTPSRDSASCKNGRKEGVAGREGGSNGKHSGIPGWKKPHRSPNESSDVSLKIVYVFFAFKLV